MEADMISSSKLSAISAGAMALFGLAFWTYGILTLILPRVFAPHGYILAILGIALPIFLFVTAAMAGKASATRAWDEGEARDSSRAHRFGFTVAWVVYLVFWLITSLGWGPLEAAFPAMGAFTGGSYCLYLGVVGLKGWYETHKSPD